MTPLGLSSAMAFGDSQALMVWFADHFLLHNAYVPKLQTVYLSPPPSFDLADTRAQGEWIKAMRPSEDPVPTPSLQAWLLAHENLHRAEWAALGYTQGIDLSTVDFRKERAFYDWMNYHQQMHDAEDTQLL
jgi:hypothetical protein